MTSDVFDPTSTAVDPPVVVTEKGTSVEPAASAEPDAAGFKFRSFDGSVHVLPSINTGRKALTGRDLRDAAVDGEVGQLAYLFKALEAAKPDPAALDALYGMRQEDMLQVLQKWAAYGDGDGEGLGE